MGSGDKRQPGWLTVDIRNDPKWESPPDFIADLRNLPFDDDHADEIRAIHIIEHFHPWEAQGLISEWTRVLKPGCKIAIECPDLDKVMALWNVPQIPPAFTWWAIYGDPRHCSPEMMHKWIYNHKQLARLMDSAGLVDITPGIPQFHHPIRDLRIIGYKPKKESVILGAT